MTTIDTEQYTGVLGGASIGQHNRYSPTKWSGTNHERMFFEVVVVANGFLLKHSKHEGGAMTTHIAADMDELRDLFTSVLVTQKLEKANG
jgi:hypothetical protein